MSERLVVLALLAALGPFIAAGCDSEGRSGGRTSRTAAMRAAREAAASHKICRQAESAKRRIPRECRVARQKKP
jgi:hypothetical protein